MPAAITTVQYEGYGPGGTAVLIECAAPERHDVAALLRPVFAAHGGHLGAHGSVSYLFARTGVLLYADEPVLADLALAAGAEDVVQAASGGIEILTDPDDFQSIREALAAAGYVPLSAQITQRAATTVELSGAEAQAMRTFVAGLGTVAAVQGVFTNARFAQ
ncbi:MAG: YebC/PmpR family DNA-binding transcriptional regulator [Steroidobacteraceae bacterium]